MRTFQQWIGIAAGACAAAVAGTAPVEPVRAATITVEIATDDPAAAACTLRDAISAANADSAVGSCTAGSGDDEIVFAPGLSGQTILLSNTGSGEDGNDTGDLDVNDPDGESLTIVGPAADDPASIVVDGNGTDRVFDAYSPLGLRNLTVTGGGTVAVGGGIRTDDLVGLSLAHVDVLGNSTEASVGTASLRGGGIYIGSTASLDHVVVAGNMAVDDAVSPLGGGIYLGATTSEALALHNSTITGNVAASNGDHSALGGGIYAFPGSLVLDDSVVTGNRAEIDPASGSAQAAGGGINFRGSGDLTIADSTIRGNTARLAGTGSSVAGGGINLLESPNALDIVRSEISGNTVAADGAAVAGGGIRYQTDGNLTLSNSTISGNRIEAPGGLGGGGLFVGRGTVELNNVTITANTVVSPGGSGGGVLEDGGDVIASNTIVAGNTAPDGPDCAGPFISRDYNLIGDDAGCTITPQPGDLINRDPTLAALADNGGSTRSHALIEGSPAIDAGNPNPVMDDMPPACEPADQRLEARPSDGDGDGGAVCDIGAFEGAVASGSGGSSEGGGGGGVMGWPLLSALAGAAAFLVRRRSACAPRGLAVVAAFLVTGSAQAATITVDTANDEINANGECSLREAVINANNDDQSGSAACAAGAGTDEIVFDPALHGMPIVLSITGRFEESAMTGDLDVTEDLVVEGTGAIALDPTLPFIVDSAATTIDADGIDRVFEAHAGRLELRGLRVTGGDSGDGPGGGIRVHDTASLRLIEAVVDGNRASIDGGGISAAGEVVLLGSWLQGNTATNTDGTPVIGGGITARAGLLVGTSVIVLNRAESSGSAQGGGIAFDDGAGQLEIQYSIVLGNEVENTASAPAYGGGLIVMDADEVSLGRTHFDGNSARGSSGYVAGGGVHLRSGASLDNVALSANYATSGSGMANGAGVDISTSSDITLRNTTISMNHAEGSGNPTGGLRGSGISVQLANTVIAGNTATGGTPAPDCSGSTITSLGYNFIGASTGCSGFVASTGDQVGDDASGGSVLDPRLEMAGDNGGGFHVDRQRVPMTSLSPAPDSPLVDAGDPNPPGSGGTCLTEDQRNYARPADGDGDGAAVCDIGAIELGGSPPGTGGGSSGGSGGGGAIAWMAFVAFLATAARSPRRRLGFANAD